MMNKLEHKIVKVLEKPKPDDSVIPGWYSMKVVVECYGIKHEEIMNGPKEYLSKYKKGYTWMG